MSDVIRFFVRKGSERLDSWMHFHRFEWRSICDLHDVAHGMDRHVAKRNRKAGEPAHRWMQSYRNHPSRSEVTSA